MVTDNQTSRSFAKLMFEGKTKAALDVVSSRGRSSVLNLDQVVDTDFPACVVRDVLRSKHPPAQHGLFTSWMGKSTTVSFCHL